MGTPLRSLAAQPPGTLLGVWAHPDDEAYLSAGLMAGARDAGWRVVVATATWGEQGTDDPQRWPPDRLGPLRERELADSLAVIGVDEHHWLGHRDGHLAEVPDGRGVEQVAGLLAQLRPDVVVTFGPEGMTGHDDHRTVSAWTTAAWRDAGAAGRLWWATKTPEFHAEWGELNASIGLWFEGTVPPETPRDELALELALDEEQLDRKHRAIRAHRSQTAGLEQLMGPDRFRRWWAVECFAAAPAERPVEQPVGHAARQSPGSSGVANVSTASRT